MVETKNLPAKNKSCSQKTSGARKLIRTLGPGLVTGASDDDPSGIATYSQVGAQFGYGILWTTLFSYPLMVAIQEISARVGRVTGRGIAGNMRRHYPIWLLYGTVLLQLIATVFNLGADINAMGDAAKLLLDGPGKLYAVALALASLTLQVFIPYRTYVNVLKWLTLALFSYVATVFVIHAPWGHALRGTFLPSISLKAEYLSALVAVLGTTISPYLFFWQASEEVEDQELNSHEKPLKKAPHQAPGQLRRIRLDTLIGMAISNLVAFFIILTVAATLHTHGLRSIETSAQAAEALRPLAGPFAFALFTAGIVGTGLLAIPVLAGSAAYAVGEAFKWPVGLEHEPRHARGFYAVIAGAILIGLSMEWVHINPIKALYWSAILNGIIAGPIMVTMMLMATNPKVMGQFTLPCGLRITGWLATAVMIACSVTLFATLGG
jgi:NRAMP (natural resistance-associated macrophage protein)-like metal ion transporter